MYMTVSHPEALPANISSFLYLPCSRPPCGFLDRSLSDPDRHIRPPNDAARPRPFDS